MQITAIHRNRSPLLGFQTTREIADAFANQQSGLAVSDSDIVDRVLSDDTEDGRHQRFILRLASGPARNAAPSIPRTDS